MLPSAAAPARSPSALTPAAGPCAPGASYDPACNVDHDNDVDIFDIQLAAGHWNQSGTWTSDNNNGLDVANAQSDGVVAALTDSLDGVPGAVITAEVASLAGVFGANQRLAGDARRGSQA